MAPFGWLPGFEPTLLSLTQAVCYGQRRAGEVGNGRVVETLRPVFPGGGVRMLDGVRLKQRDQGPTDVGLLVCFSSHMTLGCSISQPARTVEFHLNSEELLTDK